MNAASQPSSHPSEDAPEGSAVPALPARFLTSQRWRRLMPVAFITYSFAYLDRSNYSLGSAGGLTQALHITSAEKGLLGGLFFIGYFIFQIPAANFVERRSLKPLMFWSLILWGIFAALQGAIPTFYGLLIDRFLLGVVEATVIPTMLILLTRWFSGAERGRANTFLILGNPVTLLWMSIVSGYIIQATSYRWMFVIEGLPAIGWAFYFRAVVSDYPRDAKWLDRRELEAVEARLAAEEAQRPEVAGYLQALRSRNVIILAVQYAFWSIGVYGFVFFLPTIVKSLSQRGIGTVGALSAVPYALAVILMLAASYGSDHTGRRRIFVWPFLLVATGAFYASYALNNGGFVVSFVLLIIAGGFMYAPYGPYFALIPELLPENVAGSAMAGVNALGAVGGFVGAYVVGALGGGTQSGAAFVFMAASLFAAAVLMFFVRRPPTPPTPHLGVTKAVEAAHASPTGLRREGGWPLRARPAADSRHEPQ